MIDHLKYFHGTGFRSEDDYPEKLLVAVSIRSPQITKAILRSFNEERIEELSGSYGDRNAGDPIEIDRLEIRARRQKISVTVFNRGISMLCSNNEEIQRLHRFFGVIEQELKNVG